MHAPAKYLERFPGLEPERRTYAAMIAAMDDAVGQVMSALREMRLSEDTLVMFSADNGATREKRAGLNQNPATAGINAPFRGSKFSVFEGGMHVPMLISWSGAIPKGQVVREIGSHLDLLPTICKAAGAALPANRTIDGADALPMASTGAKSPHDAVYWSQGGQLGVRRGPWKLVLNGRTYDPPDGDKPLPGEDELFLSNLDDDPGESKNLRRAHPNVVDELQTMAERWLKQVQQP